MGSARRFKAGDLMGDAVLGGRPASLPPSQRQQWAGRPDAVYEVLGSPGKDPGFWIGPC